MKIRKNYSLDLEEIEMAKQDAPRGNVSQYIGDLIRKAHSAIVAEKANMDDPYWNTPEGIREIIDRG